MNKNRLAYQKCYKVLNQHRKEIEQLPNFDFVDIGYKIVNGKITEDYAIRIFIKGSKVYQESSFLRFIADNINEVKTDIIPTFSFQGNCSTMPDDFRVNKVNPLMGGISIGPYEDIGTLGLVMNSDKYGLCAIGTFHGKHIGKELFQPSPQESKSSGFRKIGRIENHYHGKDITIMSLDELSVTGQIAGLETPKTILNWSSIENLHFSKEIIYKSGRSTGITKGFISGLTPSQKSFTISPIKPTDMLSCKGDSGSFYVKKNGDILGVHKVGSVGDNIFARASSIDDMVDFWGLSILEEFV